MKFNVVIIVFLIFSCNKRKNQSYISESNGRINDVTIVMNKNDWKNSLGNIVREELSQPYEGLPIDEPKFNFFHLNPKAFSGFTKQSRNIIWFVNNGSNEFKLMENPFAKPQIVIKSSFEDNELHEFYFKENINLIINSILQNERKEKLRRIKKSLSKSKDLENLFGIKLKYPSAYKTVKDTINFIWIQKNIPKGHMNIISYSIPKNYLKAFKHKRIISIRDSIGKIYIPGRLKGSYMITEKAYKPFFYKTKKENKLLYITKGTWEVYNDFMAGPFINFFIEDFNNNRWIVIEGFTFAPSTKKRDYMFELETILNTIEF